MRFGFKTLVAAAAGLWLVPQVATADDVEEQLQQMQDRLSQLEDQLKATNDQLQSSQERAQQQQQLIEDAGLGEGSAVSGLARFLEQTEFGGHVAASYFYNLNDPNEGTSDANTGADDLGANPFHPDHNSFKLDQLWFSMEKAPTEESRAGFQADILFGETADVLGDEDDGNLSNVYTANVQYLAPLGGGVKFTAGRYETHVGAETANTTKNFNITRGLLYSTLQPINHVGIKMGAEYDSGFSWMIGGTNDSLVESTNSDTDDDKALIYSVGFAPSDTLAMSVNGIWGSNSKLEADRGRSPPAASTTSADKSGIVDLVVNWDPSENLSTWVNADYFWTSGDNVPADPRAFGVAAAGRMALSDRSGVAVRGEYIDLDNFIGAEGDPQTQGEDGELWSVTGTVDHALTDQLTLKGEVVWQKGRINNSSNDLFFKDRSPPTFDADTASQVLLGAEVVYEF